MVIPDKSRQFALDFPHRSAYGREDFLIAPCNEEAVKWIDLWPSWPAPACVLYGEEASGKTHLSYVWQNRAEALRIPKDDLEGAQFASVFERNRAVIIDDIDNLIGNVEAETALFHLYNLAKEEGGTLLFTARTVPSSWAFSLPDLRSRLCAAPHVAIHAPDDVLLQSILVKLFSDRQLDVSNDVIQYVLPRMERSFKFARYLVDSADKIALSQKKPITVSIIKEALNALADELRFI